jgi:hypothetical protein
MASFFSLARQISIRLYSGTAKGPPNLDFEEALERPTCQDWRNRTARSRRMENRSEVIETWSLPTVSEKRRTESPGRARALQVAEKAIQSELGSAWQ